MMRSLVTIVFLGSLAVSCSTETSCSADNEQCQLEHINPPVNAQLADKGTHYELTFNAYNVETHFGGYGLFTGTGATTDEAKNAAAAKTTADLLCSSSADFSKSYIVQLGDTTLIDGVDCPTSVDELDDIAPASVTVIQVRAFVDRSRDKWSEAATALVP